MWKRFWQLFRRKKRYAPLSFPLNPRLLSVYFGNVNRGK